MQVLHIGSLFTAQRSLQWKGKAISETKLF